MVIIISLFVIYLVLNIIAMIYGSDPFDIGDNDFD